VTDRLGGVAQVGVVGVAQGLRDQRDHLPRDAGARQRVLQRLLDHVTHPPRRPGHQDAERQRLHLVGRDLVARQLVAHLGPVSVNQRDPPAVPGQVHDRRQALARMAELIRDRGALARWRDGVPTQRDDDGAWHHGAAT